MTEFVESIVSFHTQNAWTVFHIILISWMQRLEVVQGQSQGQSQVKKGHYIQKSHSDHVTQVGIMAHFGHRIRWSRWFGRMRPLLDPGVSTFKSGVNGLISWQATRCFF